MPTAFSDLGCYGRCEQCGGRAAGVRELSALVLRRPDGRRTPLPRFLIERLRGHIEIAGPDDRPELRIDPDLREKIGVAQRCEHATPLAFVERDVADDAVLERQTQLVIADHLDVGDVDQWGHVRHEPILGEGLDWKEAFVLPCARPVGEQLVLVKARPFLDQPYSAGRQTPCEHASVDGDRRALPGVFGVEMRDRMVALSPVHRNHDSVEVADPRHYDALSAVTPLSPRSLDRLNACATSAASSGRGA
jgi:hypothetical protein